MSEDVILNAKQKEMIALGASIAAGCQPCTIHHIKAARAAAVCDKGTTLAISSGSEVRREAADAMFGWAVGQLGGTVDLPEEWLSQQKFTRALVSVAAAFAVNSITDFHRFAEEAHHNGATDPQLQVAIAIARKIKSVVSDKMEAAAQQRLAEYGPETNLIGGRCGCSA